MPKHYVTFGQDHLHKINGKTIDNNTVVRFETENATTGREKAFALFGRNFCFDYHGDKWKEENMEYFPSGYIDLD